MTRKDYILIAEALRKSTESAMRLSRGEDIHGTRGFVPQPIAEVVAVGIAEEIADALASANPRFDREHFLAVVRGEKELNSRPTRR